MFSRASHSGRLTVKFRQLPQGGSKLRGIEAHFHHLLDLFHNSRRGRRQPVLRCSGSDVRAVHARVSAVCVLKDATQVTREITGQMYQPPALHVSCCRHFALSPLTLTTHSNYCSSVHEFVGRECSPVLSERGGREGGLTTTLLSRCSPVLERERGEREEGAYLYRNHTEPGYAAHHQVPVIKILASPPYVYEVHAW